MVKSSQESCSRLNESNTTDGIHLCEVDTYFTKNAAQIWRGSMIDQKREILESVSLNRLLGDVTLVVEKRKPFDELAKRPLVTPSRDSDHRFEPMQALVATCVREYPANRPPQLRFLARLVSEPSES